MRSPTGKMQRTLCTAKVGASPGGESCSRHKCMFANAVDTRGPPTPCWKRRKAQLAGVANEEVFGRLLWTVHSVNFGSMGTRRAGPVFRPARTLVERRPSSLLPPLTIPSEKFEKKLTFTLKFSFRDCTLDWCNCSTHMKPLPIETPLCFSETKWFARTLARFVIASCGL